MPRSHIRVTGPMLASPRCSAKTQSGAPCKSPAVSGRNRCRMHDGALGSGAREVNSNSLKHGLYTFGMISERRRLQRLIRDAEQLLVDLDKDTN